MYCASGRRSALAEKTLKALGFTSVVDFGAMSRWKGASIASSDPGECPCKQYEELKAEAQK